VRKAGGRVRITGQLIDTTTGAHIWADRFDGSLEDIFELQDQVASSVAGAIEPKLRRAEMERAGRKPIGSLDAYDVYLRAMEQYYKFTAEGTDVAIALCEQVLAIDEAYAPAAALIANCRRLQRSQGWRPVSQAEIAEAVRLARRAIEIGRDDPDTLKNAAAALYYLGGDNAAASAAIDRALALNPYSARAWGLRGWIDVWLGQPEAALEACEKSMRLSPLDPLGFNDCMGAIAFAHALAGRYDAAVDWADRCLREQPRVAPAIRLKAAACARLGRIEEARDCVRLMREIEPGLTIAYYKSYLAKFAPPDFVTFLVEGLRKAGLPEE
jgi:adenylate cyclase